MVSLTIDAKNRLYDILNNMNGKRVLVVGDLILDQYIEAITTRLAREAPIPISKVIDEHSYAGGAGNLAANIVSLGGYVFIAGIIGMDYEGDVLSKILSKHKIDTNGIVRLEGRMTSVHTRYYVDKHLHLRIDKEITTDLDRHNTENLFTSIRRIIDDNDLDCICISDYDKGCITPRLL